MQFFHGTNIDFITKRMLFFFVSLTIIVIGISATLGLGVRYGIDFDGAQVTKSPQIGIA